MHMAVRSRSVTHTRTAPVGYMKSYFSGSLLGTQSNVNRIDYNSTCVDTTGSPRLDHTLSISRFRANVEPINGRHVVGGTGLEFSNFDPTSANIWGASNHLTLTHPVSNTDAATQVLARTNPNKYAVNGPVSFLELRELPLLLKKQGDNIIEHAAGGYLTWQFGWKPLISDLKKLLDFNGLVDKKVKELEHLYQRGGLHRKRSFGTVHTELVTPYVEQSAWGVSLPYKLKAVTSKEKWATVRWSPTVLPPRDKASLRRQAIQIVYGLELSPSNVWEATPWSWLVDWFSNVGDYLSIYNGVVPVKPSVPCVMERTTTVRHYTPDNFSSGITGGNATSTYQTELRSLVGAGLTASIPFLTGRQLSILGSLAILRLR